MKTDEVGPSLLAAFARVPDVYSRHGRRYALPALLTLATAAMLVGARSVYAISQWGRLRSNALRPSSKQEAEVRVAPRLVRQVAPWLVGRVVSGDAW